MRHDLRDIDAIIRFCTGRDTRWWALGGAVVGVVVAVVSLVLG